MRDQRARACEKSMTEYWVSQAKHWCEYCRIYIGGSKQSIAFHEAGKKHKEIVELSLKDMRKRGREKRAQDSEVQRELEKIERNAMKDYMAQDIAGMGARQPAAAMPADQAAKLAELEAKISADRMARAFQAAGGGQALPPGWAAMTNPDGKVYYEHAATGAIQWDPPSSNDSSSSGAAAAGSSSSSSSCGAGHGAGGAAAAAPPDYGGWQQGWTEHGVCYYYHMQRQITQWEEPPEWTAAKAAKAAGSRASGAGGDAIRSTSAGTERRDLPLTAAAAGEASAAVAESKEPFAASRPGAAATSESSAGGGEDGNGGGEDATAAVDETTGLGAWEVVTSEDKSQAEIGWEQGERAEKRQKVSWATNRREIEEEEEEDRLRDLQMSFAIPDDMKAAVAKAEAADREAAEAAEEAAKGAAVFAKRKGPVKGAIRKKMGL